MCGITGMVALSGDPVRLRTRLKRMCDVIAHRGPDGEGQWDDGLCYLGNRRLAILDLTDTAAQPFQSADGRYQLTYNGEIYNFVELRTILMDRGYSFRSTGDTEVLLYWLIEFGAEGIERLNGIFAFGLWDSKAKVLLAARDHYGVKPFYYHFDGERLVFGSELKCLAAAGVPVSFDEGTLDELLIFRFTAGERTPLKGMKRLLPGTLLKWKDGLIETKTYWSLLQQETGGEPEFEEYGSGFERSVFEQRIADVPIGVLLSGGLDSSAIAASLAEHDHSELKAFNIGFADKEFDEGGDARQVAKWYGIKLFSNRIPENEVVKLFRTAHRYKDEPYAHANDAFIFHISALAKQHVKVLLSGEGADETLAGYVRYRPLLFESLLLFGSAAAVAPARRLTLSVWPAGSARIRKLMHFLNLGNSEEFAFLNTVNILPMEVDSLLGHRIEDNFEYRHEIWEATRRPGRDLLQRTMIYDQLTYLVSLLDRNDRMTMGASIECRVPFLSTKLTDIARRFSSGDYFNRRGGKRPLRQSMQHRLPDKILHKRKWGFGVPWKKYFRDDPGCRQVFEHMKDDGMAWTGSLGKENIKKVFKSYNANDDRAFFLIFELFFLELWAEERLGELKALSAEANRE